MSLLMKALKRAEENRPPAPNTAALSADELELEELTAETLRPHRSASAGGWSSATAAGLSAARSPATAERKSVLPWVASLAALILTGWGIYVYMMVRAPAPLTVALPPPALLPPAPEIRAAAEAPVPPSEPADAGPMQGSVAGTPRQPASDADRAAPSARMQGSAPESPENATTRRPENTVAVTRGAATSAPSPLLLSAYRAFQEGRFEEAHAQYRRLLQSEPRSQDALLGLAAIAARRGDTAEAGKYYLRAAELDPNNAVAQAGLASLVGASDPAAAEARLKHLLASQGMEAAPEQVAALHFALGNLYSEQSRWSDAEQAYFQAQRLAPGNPDYAFNLAVSLDHLFQAKPALMYYRRAEQLSLQHPANFSLSALAARLSQLSATHDTAAVDSRQR